MDIIKGRAHPATARRTARTAVHPADHDGMVAQRWVLAAAFAVLLAAVLANAGW